MDNLLCGKDPAGVAAHPVGQHCQRDAPPARVRQDGYPVLLLATVTLVLGDAGIDRNRH